MSVARVTGHVERAVLDLMKLRQHEPKWTQAFSAVQRIALSPQKSLVRPRLVLLGSDLQDPSPAIEGLEMFAAGVELHHLFMFVHDDLMDHAFTRRGVDTIQVAISTRSEHDKRYFSNETVQHLTTLVGDVLQAKSFELLQRGEQLSGSKNQASIAILEGAYSAGAAQFDDLLGWAGVEKAIEMSSNTHDSLLRRLLYDKASHHSFAAPVIAGMRLGGNVLEEQLVIDWAEHCGAAYQALDDVLDLVVDVAESGKDKLQDIKEGRLSLPLFLLRQRASGQEWRQVYDLLGGFQMSPSERHLMIKLVEKYQLPKAALGFANQEIESASKKVKEFKSMKLQNGLNELLEALKQRSASLNKKIE